MLQLNSKQYNRTNCNIENVLMTANFSKCEWHYIFDHLECRDGGFVQLFVQRWKNEKIIYERHC